MSEQENNAPPAKDGGLEKISQHGRVDYRMVTDDQKLTPELERQIIEDLKAYRADNPRNGQPLAWGRLANLIGVSQGTLVDVVKDKYKGDTKAVILKIDRFLSEDRERAGRFDFRTHAHIGITEAVFGTIKSGIRRNTMPVIIGSPGTGKSTTGRAFALDRGSVVVITADPANRNDRAVTRLLCNALDGLRQFYNAPHHKRLTEIMSWLRKHGATVIIVDEAQQLDRDGLEMLRAIHDKSDPANRRRIPIIFFGDHDFYKLLQKGRAGQRSTICAQLARRMTPVLDIDRDCQMDDEGGLYSVEDIIKIIRNNRVRLLSSRGLRWLRALANVHGFGKLGFALDVLGLAIDVVVPPGGTLSKPIDVDALQEALEMTVGRSVAIEVDEAASGELTEWLPCALAPS